MSDSLPLYMIQPDWLGLLLLFLRPPAMINDGRNVHMVQVRRGIFVLFLCPSESVAQPLEDIVLGLGFLDICEIPIPRLFQGELCVQGRAVPQADDPSFFVVALKP